jgi:hypothetical protein
MDFRPTADTPSDPPKLVRLGNWPLRSERLAQTVAIIGAELTKELADWPLERSKEVCR